VQTTTPARRGRIRLRLAVLAVLTLASGFLAAIVAPVTANAYTSTGVNAGDIVYDHSCSGQRCIGIRDGSTGDTKDVTSSGRWDYTPAVSPDGSRIAFVASADDNSGSNTIHVMNSDGSNITELVPRDINSWNQGTDSTSDTNPQWSPDGQWIVFNRGIARGSHGYYYQIDKVRADGSDLSTVTSVIQTSSSTVFDLYPAWSPAKDGSDGNYRIAFVSNQGDTSNFQIYIVDSDGSNLHLASSSDTETGSSVSPNWSPDGTRVYFVKNSKIDYYSSSDGFTTSGATVHTLLSSSSAISLALSADGNTLVYFNVGSGVTTLDTSGSASPVTLSSSTSERNPTFVPADWSMKHFAVLGDSYSSGEGVPDFISPTDTDGCHRSTTAYAEDLTNYPFGMTLSTYGFQACAGATSSQILSGMNGESAQTGAITSSDNYVILTVGGNNVGFPTFAYKCVIDGCPESGSAYSDVESSIQNDLPGQLDSFFSSLSSYVGSKRVLVLGYPEILPPTTASYSCTGLSSGSQTAAKQVEVDLNSAILEAVADAGSPFEFVAADGTNSPFNGHQLCASDPYFHSVNWVDTYSGVTFGDISYSYHPNAEGQAAYMRLVMQYLSSP
jgi:Tol biopolymer transport system component